MRVLPKNPKPNSDDEAFVLAKFTDLLIERGPESQEVKEFQEKYSKHESLPRLMKICIGLRKILTNISEI